MEGILAHYRMGRHHTSGNQMVLYVGAVDSRKEAESLVGKAVVYHTGAKEIKGEITGLHGNSGAVRVRFETGMPGQAIGKKVKIL